MDAVAINRGMTYVGIWYNATVVPSFSNHEAARTSQSLKLLPYVMFTPRLFSLGLLPYPVPSDLLPCVPIQ